MTGSQVGSSGALYQSRRVPPDASASTRPTPVRSTTRPLVIACASFLLILAATCPATADEDCREIERDYQIIAADANTLQRNAALFSAADRGCEALAQKLLDAGAALAGARPARRHAAHPCGARRSCAAGRAFSRARRADRCPQCRRRHRAVRRRRASKTLDRRAAAEKSRRSEPSGPLRPHAAHGRGVPRQRPHRRRPSRPWRRSPRRAT